MEVKKSYDNPFFSGGAGELLATVGRRCLRPQLKGWPSGICRVRYLVFGHQVFFVFCIWYLAIGYFVFWVFGVFYIPCKILL